VVLNRREKEQLVIKLHQEGKTIREIAFAAHMSFGDIGKIVRRIDGRTKVDDDFDLNDKSKTTQALHLFKIGKKPIDVAIELDLSSSEVENMLQEFWVLNQLDELALVYHEIKNHLTLFLRLFHIMKRNKMINQKDLQTILKHTAHDIPSLENKLYRFANSVIDLEIRKKEMNAQLFDLGQAITQYHNIIDSKKLQLMKMDKQLAFQHG
jgi:hypothetical protein